MFPGLFNPMLFSGDATRSYQYQTTSSNTSDASSYTFSAQTVGIASSSRTVVVACNTRRSSGGSELSPTVTVGGITATICANSQQIQDSGRNASTIFVAEVPSGTTADIVVNWGLSTNRCGIYVWSLYNMSNVVSYTSNTSSLLNPGNMNLTVESDSIIIATAMASGAPTAFDWTGVTEISENVIESGLLMSAADYKTVSAESPRSIAINYTGGDNNKVSCVAAFK